jgi:Tol biopolymer transport system component
MVTNPLFSPDGRFLLYQSGNDLMRYDWKTGEVLNLTGGKGLNRYASWSPVLKRK